MVIGDPKNADKIYDAFRSDSHYLGGGTGSGFKDIAPQYLDELDSLAKQIGSINVVTKTGQKLKGYNTDGIGFVRGLEELLLKERNINTLKSLQVLILGAGGTARAIAFTLASKGAKITILNRTIAKADELAKHVREAYGDVAKSGGEERIESELPRADIVVNTSTKGAEGPFKDFSALSEAKKDGLNENLDESKKRVKLLKKDVVVVDINLRSDESATLRIAREAGYLTQDGSSMNLFQAIEAMMLIHDKEFKEAGISKDEIAKLIREVS
jgi:shikimate dehydrogenase